MITTKPLFIFEMANNHQGSVEHGKKIIREIKLICESFSQFDFAFKFQYRHLQTYIHSDYKERFDIKNIKRFQDTKLTIEEYGELLDEVRKNGFKAICTPFDEESVDCIGEQKYDYIKIASCSFSDWTLLEKIAEKNIPVIASGATASMDKVKNVVYFFENRGISISLMHCVAEYPTFDGNLQMNQIDLYKKEFPQLKIGFSTHEVPDNFLPISLAIAKGASIFEKHVGITTDNITLNSYSADPSQILMWLTAAKKTYEICGIINERYVPSLKEKADLNALKRGVFAKNTIKDGKDINKNDIYLAFPCKDGQLSADELSKYNRIYVRKEKIDKDKPIMLGDVEIYNISDSIVSIMKNIVDILKEANVVIPMGSRCEISHHYGIEKFYETGVALIDCVNREYCKKILVLLPGQVHPSHYHIKKEETFVILHGELSITLNGSMKTLHKGDVMTVEREVIHDFSSKTGCIFEEISTTHYTNDSIYEDDKTFATPRKTTVHFTKGMLSTINR